MNHKVGCLASVNAVALLFNSYLTIIVIPAGAGGGGGNWLFKQKILGKIKYFWVETKIIPAKQVCPNKQEN